MAGHSQFKNIMHRKNAQDAKRAKKFTKAGKAISVAVKMGGDDPEKNPRLRMAINSARAINMPKDKIEAAIKKASSGNEDENYHDMRYEGYGPGGIAILVEALTDNRNRTASDVRSTFAKYGGQLGETNSVAFMFDHLGEILYTDSTISEEEFFEAAIEAGANDCEAEGNKYLITCATSEFHQVKEILENKFGESAQAHITWRAQNQNEISAEHKEKIEKLIDVLDDLEDVQNVYHNAILY